MEFIHYLIYPIAGIFILLGVGGLATRHPVVIIASAISIALNLYAIFAFIWWPIVAGFAVDWIFKLMFGDPGSVD